VNYKAEGAEASTGNSKWRRGKDIGHEWVIGPCVRGWPELGKYSNGRTGECFGTRVSHRSRRTLRFGAAMVDSAPEPCLWLMRVGHDDWRDLQRVAAMPIIANVAEGGTRVRTCLMGLTGTARCSNDIWSPPVTSLLCEWLQW
jgi:hypothetical protein